MNCKSTICIPAVVATVILAGTIFNPVEARTGSAELLKHCEAAIRTELGDGNTRIKRVSSSRDGAASYYWLGVRFIGEGTDSGSKRFRALCTIDRSTEQAVVELTAGGWRKPRNGNKPVPTND